MEVIDTKLEGKKITIKTIVRSICPISKNRDVCDLRIEYVPSFVSPEFYSFKKFIMSFMNREILFEDLYQEIYEEMMKINPDFLEIYLYEKDTLEDELTITIEPI